MAAFFERLLAANDRWGGEYAEPYAGGGSLALSLLLSGAASRVYLNDLDPAVYSFWWAALNKTDLFLDRVACTPLTLSEWDRQKSVYSKASMRDKLALGFATFFLNRTNHSGIMNGGVIGGRSQQGEWLIDARFERERLIERILQLSSLAGSIQLTRMDALKFLKQQPFSKQAFVFLDPPYWGAGSSLYLNAYGPSEHHDVALAVSQLENPWAVSYDDVPPIRRLYAGWRSRRMSLLHTARSTRVGSEIVFFADGLSIPRKNLPHDVARPSHRG